MMKMATETNRGMKMETGARLRRWLAGIAGAGRDGRTEALEPGAVFSHRTASGTTELARIVGTETDGFNIRHVRFELFYRYQFRTMPAGERTLALAAFRARFARQVRVEPATPAE